MAVLDKGIWQPDMNENELEVIDSFSGAKVLEANRYHLYISLACPFAHRPYLVIHYLGLEQLISISSVAAKRYQDGWLFDHDYPDLINGSNDLISLYKASNPHYSGRVTVPVLWDKVANKIIDNDSAQLAYELATNWRGLAKTGADLLPKAHQAEIKALNQWLHQRINTAVYEVGFASSQAQYESACRQLFDALTELDSRLAKQTFLFGSTVTLSDLFLLPTLVRFESVYAIHFKANLRPLSSFTNLYRYMMALVAIDSIRATIDMAHIKLHYFYSHRHINPSGIVPIGPSLSWL